MSGFVAPFKNDQNQVQENCNESMDNNNLSNTSDFSELGDIKEKYSPFESCLKTLLEAKVKTHHVKLVNNEESMAEDDSISLKIDSEEESNIMDETNIKDTKTSSSTVVNLTEKKNNSKRTNENGTAKQSSVKNREQKINNKKIIKRKQKTNKQKAMENSEKSKITEDNHSQKDLSQNKPKEDEEGSQDISCSQVSTFSSVFGKMVLSQAPKNFSHRQRLQWLQERRQVGLWVQCNQPDCLKWRYLPHMHDPTMLPEVWYCNMNPDARANSCDKKEQKLKIHEEEDCIHAQFSAGSLVWAQVHGYPWWPAIVDDDPDTEQFYWLDGFSDIPTHYHVTFFDSGNVTRSWAASKNLKPLTVEGRYMPITQNSRVKESLNKRLNLAINQAKLAINMSNIERLRKYSFLSCYKGPINTPKGERTKIRKRDECESASSFSDCSMVSIDDLIQEVSESAMDFGEIDKRSQEIINHPIMSL